MSNHRAAAASGGAAEQLDDGHPPPPAARTAAVLRTKHKQHRLSYWLLLLLGAAATAFLASSQLLHAGVHPREASSPPIQPHIDAAPVDEAQHIASERMLRMLTEECSKGEDSVMWIDPEGSMVVQSEVDPQQCPAMDIMLRGSERSIGMCTDAMLYVLHLGARLIGAVSDMKQYNSQCGPATARLFMENMYESFYTKQPGVLHLQLVNAEHLYVKDAAMHRRMDAFLCKSEICQQLLQQHVTRMGYSGAVWLMGHTSNDPTVDLPAAAQHPKSQKKTFLHVKGRSGLKHTQQLLECWSGRPDLPTLTVVGRFSWNEVEAVVNKPNIVLYPKVTAAHNNTQTEHISFSQIRTFQAEHPIHVCASEREGFGHYINEARAAGALVVSTDHPPMNELITPAIGLLVKPSSTSSYETMSLGRYAPINAFLNASQLCAAADAAMLLPIEEVQRRGALARQAFLHSNAVFLARLQDLKLFLERHAEAMHMTSAPRAGLWRQQLRRGSGLQHRRRHLSSYKSFEPG